MDQDILLEKKLEQLYELIDGIETAMFTTRRPGGRLVSRPIQHNVLNICSGRTIHLASIIGILQEISGHSIEVVTDPALVRPGEPRTIQGDRDVAIVAGEVDERRNRSDRRRERPTGMGQR